MMMIFKESTLVEGEVGKGRGRTKGVCVTFSCCIQMKNSGMLLFT